MKKLKSIPKAFEELCDLGEIIDSETITERDLEKIDKLLAGYNLEIVMFENGSAINFYIDEK
jgi:hypothetical protein